MSYDEEKRLLSYTQSNFNEGTGYSLLLLAIASGLRFQETHCSNSNMAIRELRQNKHENDKIGLANHNSILSFFISWLGKDKIFILKKEEIKMEKHFMLQLNAR